MPHIEGLVEIIETLNKLENTESIVSGIEQGCAAVERDAKKKAPKRNTGELKRSITSKVENWKRQNQIFMWGICQENGLSIKYGYR